MQNSKGVGPDAAPELLLDYYRECRLQQEHLASRLQRLGGVQRGSVHIIANEGFADPLMDGVLNDFRYAHPPSLGAVPVQGAHA